MRDIIKINLKYILIALVLCAAGGGFLIFQNKQKAKEAQKIDTSSSFTAQDYSSSLQGSNASTSATATASQSQDTSSTVSSAAVSGDAYNRSLKVSDKKLVIDNLNISAPITLNVDGSNQEQYIKSLENGVAHMAKTAQPGENGNAVIFGHSSYYKSKPGSYKTVFAKLDGLKPGDIVKIVSGDGSAIQYRMTAFKIVPPEDVSVVVQDKNKSTLTLITCWPPKTTDKRYVVSAELIK